MAGLFIVGGWLYADNGVSITGYIQTDNRIQTKSNKFTWNENRLNLRLEGAPSDKYHYFSEIRLRGFGFPVTSWFSDLQMQEKNKVYPWGLEFREAYVDLYGFGLKNLDVRIGRQVIAWGTADALNPTSNISPDDLEDIFNFGEKLGTNAVNASYYIGDNLTINGVYVPVFTPATLPFGDFANAFSAPMDLPPGMPVRTLSDTVILPERKPSESSQIGLKASTNLLGYDLSLSYFKGRDDLPILSKATITPVDLIGTVDIATDIIYPEMQVVGADFAGSIGSVGIWSESAAVYMPEELAMTTIAPSPTTGQMETTQTAALDDEPYFKFVLGGDYTFKNGLYFNGQYLHGFLHERGKDELNDYFTFRLEKTFLNDKFKLVPIGGAVAINDWDDLKNNYGLVYAPELSYFPSDNVELNIGSFIIDGKGSNMFRMIKGLDEIVFRLKVSF
ncbi:MAG TPA: hypothetical protein DHW42_05385 [Candidatus Marinimicrobia bacterium]|nr:hypothetical protein [Candidatus Neomarinimicrobiota bacterium]